MPPTAPQLHQVGCAMGAAIDTIKLPQAIYYRVANAGQLLYPTSGDSTDYAQVVDIIGAIYAYFLMRYTLI